MFTSRVLGTAMVSFVLFQLAASSPLARGLERRQDTVDAGFKLLGEDSTCFDFSFSDDTFSATCVSVNGVPESSSINLNACITNTSGNLEFQAQGDAFRTCSACTLNGENLDLTCERCLNGDGSQASTINIDGTREENGNGVFVRDNGRLSCRAPVAS